MKRSGMPVAAQLMVAMILMVAVPAMAIYLLTGTITRTTAVERAEADLEAQLRSQMASIHAAYQRTVDQVRSDLTLFDYVIATRGGVEVDPDRSNRFTVRSSAIGEELAFDVPVLRIGETSMPGSNAIVDEVAAILGDIASIFAYTDGTFIRVATNARDATGDVAIGTAIEAGTERARTVENGAIFLGATTVLGQTSIAAYAPLRTDDGTIVGSYAVARDDSAYRAQVLSTMATVEVGGDGYVFVLRRDGSYVLSEDRARDDEVIIDARDADGNLFVRDMIADAALFSDNDVALTRYRWQNPGDDAVEDRITAYARFAPWDWTVGVTTNEGNVLAAALQASRVMLIILGVAVVLAILVSIPVARAIANPLARIVEDLGLVADGDLTAQFAFRTSIREFRAVRSTLADRVLVNLRTLVGDVMTSSAAGQELAAQVSEGNEETATMGRSVAQTANRVAAELGGVAGRIKEAEGMVAEISAGIGDLNRRIETQTSAVTESSASIEEMTASIDSIAQIAQRESARSEELAGTIRRGEDALTTTDESIGSIADAFDSIQETLQVINEIASSTNLLAMNAAIEAAHAGEAGRGFAVVADEIRKLSASTAENATAIGNLVSGMTSRIEATQESSGESRQVFSAITEQTNAVVAAFREIAQATVELSAGGSETLAGVAELRDTSHGIRETSEVMDRNSGAVSDVFTEISHAIDAAVTEYARMEQALEEMAANQEQARELSTRNRERFATLLDQLSRFRIDQT